MGIAGDKSLWPDIHIQAAESPTASMLDIGAEVFDAHTKGPKVRTNSSSGFSNHIEQFIEHLPEVFSPRRGDWHGNDWLDFDYEEIFGPLRWTDVWDASEYSPTDNEERYPDESQVPSTEWRNPNYAPYLDLDLNFHEDNGWIQPPKLYGRGRFPGSPVPVLQPFDPLLPPPPDALAFYLPGHLFPEHAGIYFIYENCCRFQKMISDEIYRASGRTPSPAEVIDATSLYLYAHEYYHHKVEMMSFRWEGFLRKPVYKTAVDRLYQNCERDPGHLEESLATAFALTTTAAAVRSGRIRPDLNEALLAYSTTLPPHYSRGVAIVAKSDFRLHEGRFLERIGGLMFPKRFALGMSDLWASIPFRMAGSIRPGSRLTLLINRHSEILKHLPIGLRTLRMRELVKEMERRGFALLRHGGKHDIYALASSGHQIVVPRHPGDMPTGLVKRLQKELNKIAPIR